jgi:dihydrofolate reductase
MRKLISFAHISLDGFVSGTEGEMDWIKIDDGMFAFVEKWLSDRSDTALYGRTTYEMMEGYWPTAAEQPDASEHDKQHAAWYKAANKIVLSTTLDKTDDKLTIIRNDLVNEITDQKKKPGKDIVIFGSPGATRSLAKEDLIDAYWLFINPILLGQGKQLYNNERKLNTTMKLMDTKQFPSGVISCYYEK